MAVIPEQVTENFNKLLKEIKEIEELEEAMKFEENKNNMEKINQLTKAVANLIAHASIQSLDLRQKQIEDGGAKALSEALKTNTSLLSLNLESNQIGEIGIKALSEALKTNTSLLSLNLASNQIGEIGIKALSEALKTNTSLLSLNLASNQIGKVGIKALSEALKINTSVQSLNLRQNELEVEGTRTLSESLKTNISIQNLDLGGNHKIGNAGAIALSEALKTNASIQNLNLDSIMISDAGAIALSEALKTNASLQSLNLRNHRIEETGIQALSEALKINSSVRSLNQLSHVGDVGAKALSEALKVNISVLSLDLIRKSGDPILKEIQYYVRRNQRTNRPNIEQTLAELFKSFEALTQQTPEALLKIEKKAYINQYQHCHQRVEQQIEKLEFIEGIGTQATQRQQLNNLLYKCQTNLKVLIKLPLTTIEKITDTFLSEKLNLLSERLNETRKLLDVYRNIYGADLSYAIELDKFLTETFNYYQTNPSLLETFFFAETLKNLQEQKNSLRLIIEPGVKQPVFSAIQSSTPLKPGPFVHSLLDQTENQKAVTVILPDLNPLLKNLQSKLAKEKIQKDFSSVFSTINILVESLQEITKEKQALKEIGTTVIRAQAKKLQKELQKELDIQKSQYASLEQQQETLRKQMTDLQKNLTQKSEIEKQKMQMDLEKLQEQLLLIKIQQDYLQNECEVKVQKHKSLRQFQSHPNLLLYYRTVQIKLEEVFISFKAVAGGFIDPVEGNVAIAKSIIDFLGDTISIAPVVGTTVEKILKWTANKSLEKIDSVRQNNTVANASGLVTLSEVKKYAESIARQLTERYVEQLQYLPTPEEEQAQANTLKKGINKVKEVILKDQHISSSKQLAAFVVVWMVDQLYEVHKLDTQKELDVVLLSVVIQRKPANKIIEFWKSITTTFGIEGIRTKAGEVWHPEDIYILPGIRTEKNEYYSGNSVQPEKYGWRLGTIEEAKMLGLKPMSASIQQIDKTSHQCGSVLEMVEKTGHIVEDTRVKVLEEELEKEKKIKEKYRETKEILENLQTQNAVTLDKIYETTKEISPEIVHHEKEIWGLLKELEGLSKQSTQEIEEQGQKIEQLIKERKQLKEKNKTILNELRTFYEEVMKIIIPLQKNHELYLSDIPLKKIKQESLSVILSNEKFKKYYDHLKLKLTQLFIAYHGISSGKIDQTTGKKTKIASKCIELTGNLIPLPNADIVTGLFKESFSFLAGYRVQKKTEGISEAIGDMQDTIEMPWLLASQITRRYCNQIQALHSDSINDAADCVVKRIAFALWLVDYESPLQERTKQVVKLVGELPKTINLYGFVNYRLKLEDEILQILSSEQHQQNSKAKLLIKKMKEKLSLEGPWTDAGMYVRPLRRVFGSQNGNDYNFYAIKVDQKKEKYRNTRGDKYGYITVPKEEIAAKEGQMVIWKSYELTTLDNKLQETINLIVKKNTSASIVISENQNTEKLSSLDQQHPSLQLKEKEADNKIKSQLLAYDALIQVKYKETEEKIMDLRKENVDLKKEVEQLKLSFEKNNIEYKQQFEQLEKKFLSLEKMLSISSAPSLLFSENKFNKEKINFENQKFKNKRKTTF